MEIRRMARTVHELAIEKGWYEDDPSEETFIERACNNMHNEISELHEAYRNDCLHELCDKKAGMRGHGIEPLTCMEEELADIVIRAFDAACRLGVDIESAVLRKHAYNKTRPYRHGGKKS